MEIDLTTLPDAQVLKAFLESHLPIGNATVSDTQEFLRQQNWACREEIKEGDDHFRAIIKVLKYSNQPYIQFDSCIGCKIPIKPDRRITSRNPIVWFWDYLTYRLVKYDYMVRFHFTKGTLVEIFTQKVGTGF